MGLLVSRLSRSAPQEGMFGNRDGPQSAGFHRLVDGLRNWNLGMKAEIKELPWIHWNKGAWFDGCSRSSTLLVSVQRFISSKAAVCRNLGSAGLGLA